jgi:hypothetical protein
MKMKQEDLIKYISERISNFDITEIEKLESEKAYLLVAKEIM